MKAPGAILTAAALFASAALFFFGPPLAAAGYGAGDLAEPPPDTAPRPGQALTAALDEFLTVPFRADGALDAQGQWVTFGRPLAPHKTPGFNCSGFAVAAARKLLHRPFTLAEAAFDRRGDSGPQSPLGQDWDFGLDLILNLSQDHPHRFLPPPPSGDGPPLIPLRPGRALGWGLDIHSPELLPLLKSVQPGHFAFFVFSRPTGRVGAGVIYYHVGLIVPEPPAIWLYHATEGARTNRLNLADSKGLARFRREFPAISGGERRLFLIEVIPPGLVCPPRDRIF